MVHADLKTSFSDQDSDNRTVLVTGGAGYIGSHACKTLAASGFVPVTADNLSRGHRGFVKWGPQEEAVIGDGATLDRVMARHEPVAILHFAALTNVGESVTEPALYYRNNVSGRSACSRPRDATA